MDNTEVVAVPPDMTSTPTGENTPPVKAEEKSERFDAVMDRKAERYFVSKHPTLARWPFGAFALLAELEQVSQVLGRPLTREEMEVLVYDDGELRVCNFSPCTGEPKRKLMRAERFHDTPFDPREFQPVAACHLLNEEEISGRLKDVREDTALSIESFMPPLHLSLIDLNLPWERGNFLVLPKTWDENGFVKEWGSRAFCGGLHWATRRDPESQEQSRIYAGKSCINLMQKHLNDSGVEWGNRRDYELSELERVAYFRGPFSRRCAMALATALTSEVMERIRREEVRLEQESLNRLQVRADEDRAAAAAHKQADAFLRPPPPPGTVSGPAAQTFSSKRKDRFKPLEKKGA